MTTLPTEPKGERTVLVQNPDGTTSWVDPKILDGITVSKESPEGWYSNASGEWKWNTPGEALKASVQKGDGTDILVKLNAGGSVKVVCSTSKMEIDPDMDTPMAVLICKENAIPTTIFDGVTTSNVQPKKPGDIFFPVYFTIMGIIIFGLIIHILRNHRSH